MITIREFLKASSLEEAWKANQKRPNRVLGGMGWMKMSSGNVSAAIDLSGLDLDQIQETEDEFVVGAMATLRQFETHEGLNAYFDHAAQESVRHIVGVQFRNCATMGGSVWLRAGFSDPLTLLLAMQTEVELYKGGIVPLAEFIKMPYDRDILVRVIVHKEKASFCYRSVRPTKTDFPTLTCCAARTEGGQYRFAVGARPLPAMLVCPTCPVQEMPAAVQQAVTTGSNIRGSAEYRRHLTGVLVKRCIEQLEQ